MCRRLPTALLPLLLLAGTAGAEEEYGFGRAGFGAWVVPVSLDQQAGSDLEPGQGMLVAFVRPGSTASTLGVQAGDVLLSLNGQDISSRQNIRSVIRGVQPGDAAEAVVQSSDGSINALDGSFAARLPRGPWWPQDPAAQAAMAEAMMNMAFAGPPAAGGPWQGQDPHALVTQQRQDLMAEQAAITAASALVHQILASLDARWPSDPWQLHLQISAPVDYPVVAATLLESGAPPGDFSVDAAAQPSWCVHLAIDHESP